MVHEQFMLDESRGKNNKYKTNLTYNAKSSF